MLPWHSPTPGGACPAQPLSILRTKVQAWGAIATSPWRTNKQIWGGGGTSGPSGVLPQPALLPSGGADEAKPRALKNEEQ